MKITPITVSTELHISRDVLASSNLDAIISTPPKDVPDATDLKYWLDCYPAGRRSVSEAHTVDLFGICLRVSNMPVKCSVKYSIADIVGTNDVICSKVFDPYVFSINKDVLLQKVTDAGLTFKCEVTFTDVPSATPAPQSRSPEASDPSLSRSFTDTIDLAIRLSDCEHLKYFETLRRPISQDGKLFWLVFYCVNQKSRNPQLKVYIQSSASDCDLVMTYHHIASNLLAVKQEKVAKADPIGRCPFIVSLSKLGETPSGELVIRCTASFIFRDPIRVYQSNFPAAASMKVCGIPRMRQPCQWGPLVIPSVMPPQFLPYLVNPYYAASMLQKPQGVSSQRESLIMRLPNRTLYMFNRPITSEVHKSPCGIMWWVQCTPGIHESKKAVTVYLHVLKPSCADVVYSVPEACITNHKVMTIKNSDPVLIFAIDHETITKRPVFDMTTIVCGFVFSTLGNDEPVKSHPDPASSEPVAVKQSRVLPITVPNSEERNSAACHSESTESKSSESGYATSPDQVPSTTCVTTHKLRETATEQNDFYLNLTQSTNGDSSDNGEDLSDERLLVHRLRMQAEETLLVNQLLQITPFK